MQNKDNIHLVGYKIILNSDFYSQISKHILNENIINGITTPVYTTVLFNSPGMLDFYKKNKGKQLDGFISKLYLQKKTRKVVCSEFTCQGKQLYLTLYNDTNIRAYNVKKLVNEGSMFDTIQCDPKIRLTCEIYAQDKAGQQITN